MFELASLVRAGTVTRPYSVAERGTLNVEGGTWNITHAP